MGKGKLVFPHESEDLYLTDGGLETTLIFLEGFELPFFAAFDLLKDDRGNLALKSYYMKYLRIASDYNTGFILESPTWRANPDWIERAGYPPSAISDINEKAIRLLSELKNEFQNELGPIIISGCIGPRGDGYKAENQMTASESEVYHSRQIGSFVNSGVDVISAITMTYAEEAIGIVNASAEAGFPSVISFTVETDGELPSGISIKEAIEKVDIVSKQLPLYYMINCAHPTHFMGQLEKGKSSSWIKRIKGIRANASCKSHAELDESPELDRGDPSELGAYHRKIRSMLSHINVLGGCCGTDTEHVLEIVKQVKKESN